MEDSKIAKIIKYLKKNEMKTTDRELNDAAKEHNVFLSPFEQKKIRSLFNKKKDDKKQKKEMDEKILNKMKSKSAQKITRIKNLVKLVETKTGKKIRFVEADFDLRTSHSYDNIPVAERHREERGLDARTIERHTVSEVVQFVKAHPGCTEKEIVKGVYGIEKGKYNWGVSTKAAGELIRRALSKGLITRTDSVRIGRTVFTYFTPEDAEKFKKAKTNVGGSGLSIGNIKLKESTEAEKNSTLDNLQALSSFIEYQKSIISSKIRNNNGDSLSAKYFDSFVKQVEGRLSEAMQAITSEDTLDEEVDMDIEDALKDPTDLKKLTDKNINVNLKDKKDLDNNIDNNYNSYSTL